MKINTSTGLFVTIYWFYLIFSSSSNSSPPNRNPKCLKKCSQNKPLLISSFNPQLSAHKSATENHHFWEASKASPEKYPLSLSRAKQEKFPSLHNLYRCTQKGHRKPPLLRGEQSQPWISTPLSLKWSKRSSLPTYPLPVHSKVPQKTTSFERRAKGAL